MAQSNEVPDEQSYAWLDRMLGNTEEVGPCDEPSRSSVSRDRLEAMKHAFEKVAACTGYITVDEDGTSVRSCIIQSAGGSLQLHAARGLPSRCRKLRGVRRAVAGGGAPDREQVVLCEVEACDPADPGNEGPTATVFLITDERWQPVVDDGRPSPAESFFRDYTWSLGTVPTTAAAE